MIELKNLVFSYNKKRPLFSNMQLKLDKGGIYGLLGKNGSGKTTLLKLIAGLVFPDEGSCTVMGKDPKNRYPQLLQEIYFLPEDLFVPPITAKDFVKYYASFYQKFSTAKLDEYLNEFGLTENKLLTNFSYGEKKKFLIAFGLATNCSLFILDEPTNGLDIPSKAQFRKLLAGAINQERLFIVSTHQVHDAEKLIDAIIVLDEGKIIFNQTLLNVTTHLAFMQQTSEPEPGSYIYYEKFFGGYTVVMKNNDEAETYLDLEILFNAIMANKATIQQLF